MESMDMTEARIFLRDSAPTQSGFLVSTGGQRIGPVVVASHLRQLSLPPRT
jgi:hypothetical protein